jgi:universal stress protein E
MSRQQHILVVVDPTASSHPSIDRAVWLARPSTVAHIELFVSDYVPPLAKFDSRGTAVADARAAVIERHRQRLERLAEPLRKQGLQVATAVRWDYPLHDSIVRQAQQTAAALIIKDTHYHSVLKRSIFSNTDWNLIRNCATVLWLVKPRPPGQKPCFVAAIDPLHERDKPADLDNRILETANALAGALGGEVHVFHAFDATVALAISAGSMSTPIALPINDLNDAMRAEHTEAVERLCKKHGVPPERTHIHLGGTRDRLLLLTEQIRADAVVMGAISRSGLKGLFLGNTAENILDRLHCDLIIVKPEGFENVLPE